MCCEDANANPEALKEPVRSGDWILGFMRERRSLPISSEVALKNEKDGGRLVVNSVICGVVDELSNGRSGRRGSWVRHAVMGVLRWKDIAGVRTATPTDQKEVSRRMSVCQVNVDV